MERIRIGVSACLLGERVRYNGGHKLDSYVAEELARRFEFIPVCPEFELGLGVPREPMRLEGDPDNPSLVTVETRRDLTGSMQAWCSKRVGELERDNLCGFIFKSRSPSCGLHVEVYKKKGNASSAAEKGRGMFAAVFMKRFPGIAVAEAEQLHEPDSRKEFIDCVCMHAES